MRALIRQPHARLLLAMLAVTVLATMSTGVLSCSQPGAMQKEREFINEPGLIDAHAHIGQFKGYDLSLDNLLVNLAENHVQYALVSNIDGAAIPGVTADGEEVAINEETARVTAAHPQLKPLAWAKPGATGASAANIEPFLRDKGFLGIKFHPDFNNFPANSPAVVPYLRLCEKYGVPAAFHAGRSTRSNARMIYEVARQFPKVPFILYHMGFGTGHDETIAVALDARKRGDALIYLEVAQADEAAVLRAINKVGADRVLFGTDATYYGRYHYEFYGPVLRAVKKAIPAADFARFIRGNAAELFRLEGKEKQP